MLPQAVFFDMDGTVLRDDRSISESTVQLLRNLAQSGVMIVPASGRAMESMKPYVEQLGCVEMFISSNGAEIWDTSRGCLKMRHFTREETEQILAFSTQQDCYAQTYFDKYFVYNRDGHWAKDYAKSTGLTGVKALSQEDMLAHSTNKVLMMADKKTVRKLSALAHEAFDGVAQVTQSNAHYL